MSSSDKFTVSNYDSMESECHCDNTETSECFSDIVEEIREERFQSEYELEPFVELKEKYGIDVSRISGSQKNKCLYDTATVIVNEKKKLLVTSNGKKLYCYDETRGCYTLVENHNQFVESVLPLDIRRALSPNNKEVIVKNIMMKPDIQCIDDDFNNNPKLINCRNGVVDISGEQAVLIEHDEQFRFNYCVDAELLAVDIGDVHPRIDTHPAKCHAFDEFCRSSLDDDSTKRQLLLQIIGYICSDGTAGKCGLFLKGAPDSGKSVMVDFISGLFDLSLVSHVELDELSNPFNKGHLAGKKLNAASEITSKALKDITAFKQITSGDPIKGEHKGQNPFSFKYRGKLLFACNSIPSSADSDATNAFVNRLVVLIFNQSIPKEKQDKNLLDKLNTERNAIFTLAMEALHKLCHGNYIFTIPPESDDFVRTHKFSGNSLRAFVDDCCVIEDGAAIHNTKLHEHYLRYCEHNGFTPLRKTQFYDQLVTIPKLVRTRIRIDSENKWGFRNLRLKTPQEMEHWNNEPESIAP